MTNPARNLALIRRSLSELVTAIDEDLAIAHAVGDPAVGQPVIADPTTPLRAEVGALVLGVGLTPVEPAAEDLAQRSASAGASALLLRTTSAVDHQHLAELGARHGISTVAARSTLDWLLLARQIDEAATPRSAEELSGVRIGDLFAFANLVATRTGGATAIVDATGQLLGFSSLPDQPLDELRRNTTVYMREREAVADDPDYQRVYADTGPVHLLGAAGEFDRIAVAIRNEGQVTGTIWVIVGPGRAWRDVANRLTPLLADATAHLSRAHGRSAAERSRETALLDSLVRGDDAIRAAEELGMTASTWLRLAAIVPVGPGGGNKRSLVRQVASWIRIVHRGALVSERPDQAVVLFHGTEPSRWHAIEAALDRFLHTSDSVRDHVAIATSAEVPRIDGLPGEYDRLTVLVSSVASRDAGLVRMDDEWAHVELQVIANGYRGNNGSRMSALDRIRQHDQRAGTTFWSTLTALVTAHGSVAAAATDLHVHQNTVRQRIERIRELFGIDITDADHATWLAIATRAL